MPTTQVHTLAPVSQLNTGDDVRLHTRDAVTVPIAAKVLTVTPMGSTWHITLATYDRRMEDRAIYPPATGEPWTIVVRYTPDHLITVVTTLETVSREYIVVDFTGQDVATTQVAAADIDSLVLTGNLEGALKNHADVGVDQDLVRSLVHDDTVIGMVVAVEVSWALALYRVTI